MFVDATDFLITETATIKQAMAKLNQTALGILLLVDEQGRLKRTITDGDMRRLLLADFPMTETLALLPAKTPFTAAIDADDDDVVAVMTKNQIEHLPLLNAAGQPVKIATKRVQNRIYLSAPHMGEEEEMFVEKAFRSNWIAPLGPNVDAFEQEVATKVGVKYAAALSSGTAAIHLALRLLDVKPGDVVFCSSFTFIASASPIVYQGATPVFIDSDPETWNMSAPALERAFVDAQKANKLPKAVVVVNLYGQSAELMSLQAICDKYNVPIIEDAAESLGASYKGKSSGSFGLMSVFSFNGNKIITTSGGGMLVSENKELIDRARYLSTQARQPTPHYEHTEIGYNYRMSNVLAGIGRGQLRVLDQRVKQRRGVFEAYVKALADCPAIEWMPEIEGGYSTRWLTAMTLNPKHTKAKPIDVVNALARHNIELRPVWKPLHQQPVFAGHTYYPHKPDFSVSDDLFARGLCLPSSSTLSPQQVEEVSALIKQAVNG